MNENLFEADCSSSEENVPYWDSLNEQAPAFNVVDQMGTLSLPPEDASDGDEKCHIDVSKYGDKNNLEYHKRSSSPKGEHAEKTKRKRRRLLDINLTNCRYESVRRVSHRFGFREVGDTEDCNLYWTDLSVSIERVLSMKKWQKVNHFPGMSEICRKDCLARNMNRMHKLFPKDYNIFPKTWTLPADWGELQQYARVKRHKSYIIKPDTGCQGKGIWITKTPKDIKPTENVICQIYISRPFLIDGYKFDLRLYVLVTSITNLRIFVFKDGLARFTTMPYRAPTVTNVSNVYMHLTNYAVQKHSEQFVRDNEEAGTKRRLTSVNCWLIQHGYNIEKIWEDIDDVIIKVIISGLPVLRHNYRTCFPQHVENSACFEILGFDIMLDRNLKPFVIEVNHSPSFHTDAQIDKEIKEALIWDTLQLANFNAVDRRKCVGEDRKKIQQRLLRKKPRNILRETQDEELEKSSAQAEQYELEHLGNFRRIFPSAGSEKYDKFFTPTANLFQDTVSFKARLEYSKQLREDIRQKHEKLESYMRPKNAKSLSQNMSAESPTLQSQMKSRSAMVAQLPSSAPSPICEDDERERLHYLIQRENLMRRLGVIDAVHKLLAGKLGTVNTSQNVVITKETEELPRKTSDSMEHRTDICEWEKSSENISHGNEFRRISTSKSKEISNNLPLNVRQQSKKMLIRRQLMYVPSQPIRFLANTNLQSKSFPRIIEKESSRGVTLMMSTLSIKPSPPLPGVLSTAVPKQHVADYRSNSVPFLGEDLDCFNGEAESKKQEQTSFFSASIDGSRSKRYPRISTNNEILHVRHQYCLDLMDKKDINFAESANRDKCNGH